MYIIIQPKRPISKWNVKELDALEQLTPNQLINIFLK